MSDTARPKEPPDPPAPPSSQGQGMPAPINQVPSNPGVSGASSGVQDRGYAQVASGGTRNVTSSSETKIIEVHLFKSERSTRLQLNDEEVAKLVKKLRIDPNKIVNISDHDRLKVQITVEKNLDLSTVCLHEAIQIRPGLRTKPLRQHAHLEYVKLYKCAANDPDEDIRRMLENFGEVISITHQKYQVKPDSSDALKALKNVRKGDRDIVMKLKAFLPTFGLLHTGGIVRRIKMTYQGQVRTCPRCNRKEKREDDDQLEPCPGQADAEKCRRADEHMELPTNEDAWNFWLELAGRPRTNPYVQHFIGEIHTDSVEVFGLHPTSTKEDLQIWLAERNIFISANDIVVTQNPKKKIIKRVVKSNMLPLLALHGSPMEHRDGSKTRLYLNAIDIDEEVISSSSSSRLTQRPSNILNHIAQPPVSTSSSSSNNPGTTSSSPNTSTSSMSSALSAQVPPPTINPALTAQVPPPSYSPPLPGAPRVAMPGTTPPTVPQLPVLLPRPKSLLSKFLSKDVLDRNVKTSTLQQPLPQLQEQDQEDDTEDLSAIHSPSKEILDASTFHMETGETLKEDEEDPYADFAEKVDQPTPTPTAACFTSTPEGAAHPATPTAACFNSMPEGAAHPNSTSTPTKDSSSSEVQSLRSTASKLIFDTLTEITDNQTVDVSNLSSSAGSPKFSGCQETPCVHEQSCSVGSQCTVCLTGRAKPTTQGFPGQESPQDFPSEEEIAGRIVEGLNRAVEDATHSLDSQDSALGSPSRGSSQDEPPSSASSSIQLGDRDNEPGTILRQMGLQPHDKDWPGKNNLSAVETISLSAAAGDNLQFVDTNNLSDKSSDLDNTINDETTSSAEGLNITVVENNTKPPFNKENNLDYLKLIDIERKAWVLQRKLKNPSQVEEIDREERRLEEIQRRENPDGTRYGYIWMGKLDDGEEERGRRRNSTGSVRGEFTMVKDKRKKKRKMKSAQFSSSPEEVARVKSKKKKVRTSSDSRVSARKNMYEVLTVEDTEDEEDGVQWLDGEDEQREGEGGEKEKAAGGKKKVAGGDKENDTAAENNNCD